MAEIIKKFYYSARWNAFESIFYKAILTIHQTCLFYIATKFIYGLSSFIFAIIYLTTELSNFGLDRSIAQFSPSYFSNQQYLKRYLVPQILIHFFLLLILILGALKYNLLNLILKPVQTALDPCQSLLILIIIFCESLRKTLRIISQLLFLNKTAALLELSLILIYTSLFWCSLGVGYQISIYTIYLPLVLQSLIGITMLSRLIVQKLRANQLDTKREYLASPDLCIWLIGKYRLQNYAYQLSEMVFSSNFLIYFFSTIIGLTNIGPIKLANYFAVFLKALLDKTFGLTSLALFAKNKVLIANQKIVFDFAQKKLNLLLTGLILIFGACYLIIGTHNSLHYLALLFLVFTLINNFFIVYEQLFLIHNKILSLFIINLACLATLGLLYCAYPVLFTAAQVIYLLALFAILRVASLLITKLITKSILS